MAKYSEVNDKYTNIFFKDSFLRGSFPLFEWQLHELTFLVTNSCGLFLFGFSGWARDLVCAMFLHCLYFKHLTK